MVLDLSGTRPVLLVRGRADETVVSGITALARQAALSEQIASLGGDPARVSSTLTKATPTVEVLDADARDSAELPARYAILMVMDLLVMLALMGGGQVIAMGVVQEKSSRIVEILLACVRPASLLAGKTIGVGIAVVVSLGGIGVAGALAAAATDLLSPTTVRLDAIVLAMLVWMVVGHAIYAVTFAAAASLVSRREDLRAVTMPLVALMTIAYTLTIVMALGDPDQPVLRALSYLPPLAPFMMPGRLVLGASSWADQLIALVIALAFLPALVRVAAEVYTRAVTRMGARVPLREALGALGSSESTSAER
ncbi:ABC transporter permease [Actinomyces slackii]